MDKLAATSGATHTRTIARPAISGLWWKLATGLWMSAAILAAFTFVGPAKNFPYPNGARTVLFHVPCAWLATLCYAVAAWYAVRYLTGIGKTGLQQAAVDDLK